jgi:hypothetical protein
LAGKPNKVEIRAQSAYDPAGTESSIGADYNANLVLAYERSRTVMDFLERKGIARERLRLTAAAVSEESAGMGDWLSRHMDRAEVLILDAFAADFIGPRETPR